MSVKDKIKDLLQKSKQKKLRAQRFMLRRQDLIKLYDELRGKRYSFSEDRKFWGTSTTDKGESFSEYESTSTLFKDGILTIEKHDEKEFADRVVKGKSHYYFVKPKGSEYLVYQNVDIRHGTSLNLEMRCIEDHLIIDYEDVNLDCAIRQSRSTKFDICMTGMYALKNTKKEQEARQDLNLE